MSVAVYKRVANVLEESGFPDWAAQVIALVDQLGSDDESDRQEALTRIVGLCHTRSLGDLAVTGIAYGDWGRLLEKLARYAKKRVALKSEIDSRE